MGSWCFGCQLVMWLVTWVIIQVPYRTPDEQEGHRRRRRHRRHRHNGHQNGNYRSRWHYRNDGIVEDTEAGNNQHHHARRRSRHVRVESDSSGSLGMIDDSLPQPSPVYFPHVV